VIDTKVSGAWDKVSEAWTDPALHDELFKLVVADNCFAWACARYKEKGDDPIAKAQLERLSKAAVAAMFVQQTARQAKAAEKAPYRSSMIVLATLLVAILIALFVTKFIHDNRGPEVTKPARR
jgi:hypothetical protein